jgi:hypothetical protein
MIFSHLPAGFITTYATKKVWRKGLTKRQTFWIFVIGTLAGILPDVDVLYYYVGSELSHREIITHTPILYAVISLVLFLFGYFAKNRFVKSAGCVVLFSTIVHLVLDSTTAGVLWLFPFSKRLYGMLSIPFLGQGFYSQHLFVFTLSLELLIFLVLFNLIIFWKTRRGLLKIFSVVFSLAGLTVWSVLLFNAGQHMFIRDAATYYGDFDEDGVINQRDLDMDGDGILNILDDDANGNSRDNLEEVVQTANRMPGVWYDRTEKGYLGLLSRLGFITNTDVVLKSYDQAGIFLGAEMKKDFQEVSKDYIGHPKDHSFQNKPQNIYVLCKNKGLLLSSEQKPETGDIVFYGDDKINRVSLVVSKIADDSFLVIAASSLYGVVKIENIKVSRIFGEAIAYGRIFQ